MWCLLASDCCAFPQRERRLLVSLSLLSDDCDHLKLGTSESPWMRVRLLQGEMQLAHLSAGSYQLPEFPVLLSRGHG